MYGSIYTDLYTTKSTYAIDRISSYKINPITPTITIQPAQEPTHMPPYISHINNKNKQYTPPYKNHFPQTMTGRP